MSDKKPLHSFECEAQFGLTRRCTCDILDRPNDELTQMAKEINLNYHGHEGGWVTEKPRCDFYYVLMSEEGLYFADDDYSDDNYPFTGVLRSAVMFYMEETAKTFRDSINLDAKIYKVHSPIIECCELPESKQKELNPTNLDVMRKW